jgi:hypothetical protein
MADNDDNDASEFIEESIQLNEEIEREKEEIERKKEEKLVSLDELLKNETLFSKMLKAEDEDILNRIAIEKIKIEEVLIDATYKIMHKTPRYIRKQTKQKNSTTSGYNIYKNYNWGKASSSTGISHQPIILSSDYEKIVFQFEKIASSEISWDKFADEQYENFLEQYAKNKKIAADLKDTNFPTLSVWLHRLLKKIDKWKRATALGKLISNKINKEIKKIINTKNEK